MNSESPQRLYARSLFEIAEESGLQKQTLEELVLIRRAFEEYPEYPALLNSPAISVSQKRELVDTVWRQAVSPETAGFLQILTKNRRAELLPEITDCYQELYNQSIDILNVSVLTAAPVDESLRRRLIAALERKTGKRVTLDCRMEPSVIGGMLIEMEGSRIDATVKGELEGLKRAIDSLPA